MQRLSNKVYRNRINLSIICICGVLIRLWGIKATSQTSVIGTPLPDDAFYYFSLATNIAQGKGILVDESAVNTTGFQPLWGFYLGIVNKILGNLSSCQLIHLAQISGLIFGIITGILLFQLTIKILSNYKDRENVGYFVMFSYMFSPQVIKDNLNGMETTVGSLFVVLLILMFVNYENIEINTKHSFIFGIIGGFAYLSRVDGIIIFLCCVFVFIISKKHYLLKNDILNGFFLILGFIIIILPWINFSIITSNSGFIPESGTAVRNLSLIGDQLPLISPFQSILHYPKIFIPYYSNNAFEFVSNLLRQVPLLLPIMVLTYALFNGKTIFYVASILFVIIVLIIIYSINKMPAQFSKISIIWLLWTIGMVVGYSVFIQGQWFYNRYSSSLAIILNLLLLVLINVYYGKRVSYCIFKIPSINIILVITIFGGWVGLLTSGSYQWLIYGKSIVPDDGFFRAATWINQNIHNDYKIGAFQAGLLGFYIKQDVIALDGKVNKSARSAIEKEMMFDFLCQEKIDYIVDWPKQVNKLLIQRTKQSNKQYLEVIQTFSSPGFSDVAIYKVNSNECFIEN